MANIKSAAKRVQTSELRRLRNASQKSTMRTAVKKFLSAVENNSENAKELLNKATRVLDKAATKGIIHKNNAARQKSRLTKKLKSTS